MRPKEFDRDTVLDKAMELFWRQGYQGTSIQALVEHVGINRASLYATFGDKHRLYLEAMDRYLDRIVAERLEIVQRPRATKEAIRQFFVEVIEFAVSDAERRG